MTSSNTNNTQARAKALGIACDYWDIDGVHHVIDEAILNYFIDAMGAVSQQTTPASEGLPHYDDVKVLATQSPQTLTFSPPVRVLSLTDEANKRFTAVSVNTGDATRVNLPKLSMGYYTLTIQTATQQKQRLRLIVAPSQCYQPRAFTAPTDSAYIEPSDAQNHTNNACMQGMTLQLYSLKSATTEPLLANWGIGDFSDLADAVLLASQRGDDFIGLNPLHALFPDNPEGASPYSPSSRTWRNWIYLAIGQIPEFRKNPQCLAWFAKQTETLAHLRQLPTVDYSAVSALKIHALQLSFQGFAQYASQKRRERFHAFINEGGQSLCMNSAFYAIRDQLAPDAIARLTPDAITQWIADNEVAVQFYHYLQFLVDEQLTAIQGLCTAKGVALGLYGDLAVGVAHGSADAWANPALYQLPASVGAPPDPLGPVGQHWGLSPMHPVVLKQQGFQPFIEMLRANMKHCGALRIDHVMGLYRLWLIPEGKTPADGAYIHYPFDAMMAILAIESQRAKCLIIGEDLGTVPDEVRDKLNQYGVLSYDVFYFAGRHGERWRAPEQVKQQALGVIGTHDLPPLAGWWHCRDLEMLGALNIVTGQALNALYDARLYDKQAILNALKSDGFLPADYEINAMTMAMHPRLNQAIHAYARAGNTQLFGIQPENFCGVEQAFNIPGTSYEVPNWRRKLPCALADIAIDG